MTSTTTHPTETDLDRTAVIVGVDGSEAAAAAARAAAREAAVRQSPLTLVQAFDWPAAGIDGLPADVDGRSVSRAAAARELARLAGSLADLLPSPRIGTELVDGTAVDVLCTRSARAALLVVGAHGQTWHSGTALGSVAAAVARRATCPVLLHRNVDELGGHRTGVTVGIDGGEGSRELLAAAALEARLRSTTLRVVHAWRQLTEDAAQPVRWLLGSEVTATSEAAVVEELTTQLRGTEPDLGLAAIVLPGRAGPSLVEAGDAAELLVIGRPASSPGSELPATTREVAHRASASVLLVPLPTREDADVPADRSLLAEPV